MRTEQNALMSCCLQALKDHSTLQDDRTEKQIVALLTSLLTAHEPVTVLGLSTYPEVMGLLKADAQKVIQSLHVKAFPVTMQKDDIAFCHSMLCKGLYKEAHLFVSIHRAWLSRSLRQSSRSAPRSQSQLKWRPCWTL